MYVMGFTGGSEGKESACNAGDLGSIPGLGRFPGEGNSYPLQYSVLENSIDRGAWQATVHGATKSWTRLSDFHYVCNICTRYTNVYTNSSVVVKVTQSCPTLCDPMDYTVHAILQARILECVAFPFSRGDLPNPGLLHYRQILYQLSHKGSPSVFTRDIIPLEEKVFIIEGY